MSFAIFFLLTIYNRIRENYGNVKTPNGEVSLETPEDLDSAIRTLKAKDVVVAQDLIVGDKDKSSLRNIKVKGQTYEFTSGVEELITYQDDEYGITFTIPDSVNVKKATEEDINFREKDLIVFDAEQNDDYYLKSIETIGRMKANKYDNLYAVKESSEKKEVIDKGGVEQNAKCKTQLQKLKDV